MTINITTLGRMTFGIMAQGMTIKDMGHSIKTYIPKQ